MASKKWTRNEIQNLLNTRQDAVERAILRLYKGQTSGERAASTTMAYNGIGFNAFDARRGSYYARWLLSGRKLSGVHVSKARRIALKHTRQLLAVANG